MRPIILALPAVFMCCGIIWMAAATTFLSNKTGRVTDLRRLFGRMSLIVGAVILVWAGVVIAMDIVKIAYPLVFAVVGGLLLFQGWAFSRFKLF
ncbi:MAG TPA: hypothetical protein DEF47_09425 [Herpetosiphon sp.]|uniref:Uncharacterized protein n=1 Tax=Herpetosiphon aurantiacus (strain ATCC 23779 / DSM 785 / 114-95) TaxID=316274 RepID=A9B3X3_HERA2|nr:hypothetical protein [Herpetosiphon sp.]ABX06109.1 hypothetical protein Haur_3473 [Herpetosiphon aurantiacus DSM 785]HBW50113.1 hypothetical protein [Herpetosiphon sp.]